MYYNVLITFWLRETYGCVTYIMCDTNTPNTHIQIYTIKNSTQNQNVSMFEYQFELSRKSDDNILGILQLLVYYFIVAAT